MFQCDDEKIKCLKLLGQVFLDGCKSTAGGTLFILALFDDALQLLHHDDASSTSNQTQSSSPLANPAFKYSVFSMVFLLSALDSYVHFNILNHDNYKPQTKKTDTPLFEGEASDPQTEGCLVASTPLLSSTKPAHNHKWNAMAAFICTLSCSLDTASTPVSIMALLRTAGFLPSSNENQKIAALILSTMSAIISGLSAGTRYRMAMTHLETSDSTKEEQKPPCCHRHH